MSTSTLFADVILPLYVPKAYTYRVPAGWESLCHPGQRVVVQFGKTRLYTGVIRHLHQQPPQNYQAKYLENILDEKPIITPQQFALWDWITTYYMCYPGEVFNVAMPGNLKLSSETKFYLNPALETEGLELNENETKLMEALALKPGMTIAEISQLISLKQVQPFLKRLVERRIITSEEEMAFRYKAKTETYVQLHEVYQNNEKLNDLLNLLEKRAPRQVDALMGYLKLCGSEKNRYQPVKKTELSALLTDGDSGINALVKKQVLVSQLVKVDRNLAYTGTAKGFQPLNPLQEKALNELHAAFEKHNITLLHGVTASGKTELYFRLIQETIESGKQVLFLLPEIAITTQMVNRLQQAFGDVVGVYHSRFNPNERVEVWMKTLAGPEKGYKIIIGARSAVFLPFNNLGLVIVDEEHEQSFKQHSPPPRYNGRDVAIVLASLFSCKTLLGSATPSVESYSNASNGKYGYVALRERFFGNSFPAIVTVDLKEERKKKSLREDFSPLLIEEIQKTLDAGRQVILFQNRRGYTPLWMCDDCGWVPECVNCNVSLTYHKHTHQLVCHYCNSKYQPQSRCNACGSNRLRMLGLGTEKIEETMELFFPGVSVKRMDLDTTRTKNAYRQIIEEFEQGKIQVLVGTQMVTKGLDFTNVGLVAIPAADSILHFPEFRAFERAWQLFTQVGGRAGRKADGGGKVVIQTNDVNHPVLQLVKQHDFDAFYPAELNERKKFFYPPFSRMIRLEISHADEEVVNKAAQELANILRKKLGKRLLGPERPLVNRIMNRYIENILIKLEKSDQFSEFKQFITQTLDDFRMFSSFKNVRVTVDVDPY